MQPTDFKNICSLWEKINVQPESVIQDQKNFKLMLKLNSTTCFVAEKDGDIIGSIFGLFNGRRAWIHHLGVHPAFQNQKLGAQLLAMTEDSLHKQGANRVLLQVDFHNLGIIPFYQKKGYQITLDAITFAKNL
jgi:ribosomal protein S18 acetylase RimI-like enzyme